MSVPAELRAQVEQRDQGQCRMCRLSQEGQSGRFHIDHIVPRHLGGATNLNNLALLCVGCNLHKSTMTSARDPISGAETPLFHPLRDLWDQHFMLQRDGKCVGLTAIGRATIEALQMNEKIAVTARQFQINFNLLAPTEHERN